MGSKRKYLSEDEAADADDYYEVECPECGVQVSARFRKGSDRRRFFCRVCSKTVSLSKEEDDLSSEA